MKPLKKIAIGLSMLAGFGLGIVSPSAASGSPKKIPMNNQFQISGPYSHANLDIFLVHGENQFDGRKIITLEQALDRKIVRVKETGSVNELQVYNTSDDAYIYIQAGDIVKGGKQDRTLSTDMIVPPKNKAMPIGAFCVEQGRWQRRGEESMGQFSSSKERLSTKALKLAAKKEKSQGEVWNAVKKAQDTLSRRLKKTVRNEKSHSSLQLSLEDDTVRSERDSYIKALKPIVAKKNDVVGLAFAINGDFNSADIYGASQLFTRLWPGLLQAAATEAMSLQPDSSKPAPQLPVREIGKKINSVIKAKIIKTEKKNGMVLSTQQTEKLHKFTTRDGKNQFIHMNIIEE